MRNAAIIVLLLLTSGSGAPWMTMTRFSRGVRMYRSGGTRWCKQFPVLNYCASMYHSMNYFTCTATSTPTLHEYTPVVYQVYIYFIVAVTSPRTTPWIFRKQAKQRGHWVWESILWICTWCVLEIYVRFRCFFFFQIETAT